MEHRSIGQYLQEIRQSKGLSHADVQQSTKISSTYLLAIENNEFNKLPAPTYVKGFLRLYADFLGADKEWVITEYNKLNQTESKQVLVLEGESLQSHSLIEFFKDLDPRVYASIAGIVIFMLLLFRIIFHTSVHSIMRGELDPSFSLPPPSAIIAIEGVEQSSVISVPKKGYKLFLEGTAKEDVWIRVRADGKLIFEQILRENEKEIWYAQNELTIRVGNSNNILFNFNGEQIDTASSSGKILNIRFTEKGWWGSD
ncbi:helix-turn-helix domain-containing protein [Chlamydiota bacterium]